MRCIQKYSDEFRRKLFTPVVPQPQAAAVPNPIAPAQTPVQSPEALELSNIRKNLKLDRTIYPKLSDARHIVTWWREMQSQAHHHGMSDVLD